MFKKANKKQSKLRFAIFGASGSGKTYSALRIANGMGFKIAVIDTERGSASKYADRFDFDVAELPSPKIENYVSFINAAKNYDVLIIDSLTHAWQELLSEIDETARIKYRGNSWSAWSEATPKHKRLIEAVLNFDGHIIATMRSKTEWTVEKDEKTGKNKPVRIGTVPEQGKGIEYEFDMLMDINVKHCARILKDRTGKYQDKTIDKPDENLGVSLIEWLNEGENLLETLISRLRTLSKGDKDKERKLLLDCTKGKSVDIENLKTLSNKQITFLLSRLPQTL